MLIPLTREKFEELIPAIATGAQYVYFSGKFSDFLKRLLISVVGILVLTVMTNFLGDGLRPFLLILGLVIGLYWLWGPVASAARRNFECRRYKYSGFWQGEVVDVFVTEDLIGTEERVNERGDLVIVENRERRLNLEVGDETGFMTSIRVPLRREHKAISRGDIAEMVVMSSRPDLSRIAKVSDIFLPRIDFWVSDYPYLRRDLFVEVSQEIGYRPPSSRPQRRSRRR